MPYVRSAKAISRVLSQGRSLGEVLFDPSVSQHSQAARIKAWCYQSLRWGHRLLPEIQKHYKAKPGQSGQWIEALLLLAAWQLLIDKRPAHAVVNESVKATQQLKAAWAKGLVNAILRKLQREQETAKKLTESQQWSHPDWILKRLKQDWPDEWQQIVEAANKQAPMWLRCHQGKTSRESYSQQLKQSGILAEILEASPPTALLLKHAVSVDQLPLFDEGVVSVQDAAAQWVAEILPITGPKTLDACSAPGGKAAHLLEKYPDLQLLAVEKDSKRLDRINQNCQRIGVHMAVTHADATDLDSWWDGEAFDQIMVDAPCSGSGVIRRHPDIKFLRRQSDIGPLVELQAQILDKSWSMLKKGGHLIYTTCSVFKQENHQQIEQFCEQNQGVEILAVTGPEGLSSDYGMQVIPGYKEMDGFFYALLKKTE